MQSSDWEEYWETNVRQRKGLPTKRVRMEQCENWDIHFHRSAYHELFTFEVSEYIVCALLYNIDEESNQNH